MNHSIKRSPTFMSVIILLSINTGCVGLDPYSPKWDTARYDSGLEDSGGGETGTVEEDCPPVTPPNVGANGFDGSFAQAWDGNPTTGSAPLAPGAYFEAYVTPGEYEGLAFVVGTTSERCWITASLSKSDTGSRPESAWTELVPGSPTPVENGETFTFTFASVEVQYGLKVLFETYDCTDLKVMEITVTPVTCEDDTAMETSTESEV